MPMRRANVTFSLRQSSSFPKETIIDVHDVNENQVIATITQDPDGLGVAIWSLRRLAIHVHDGGGPGNGISIAIINPDDDDDESN